MAAAKRATGTVMGSLRSDLRFVVRSLLRSPLFVLVAVGSLALGIGANTAIFSLMDQVMLRSLPIKNPQELVTLKWTGVFSGGQYRGHSPFSFPMYKALRDRTGEVFNGVAADFQEFVDIGWRGVAERAQGYAVSGNYFQTMGVRAALGRTLQPHDDLVKDAEPYVVLSYGYWQRRFGGDPSILNQTVELNGRPMTVVGVLQPGFKGTDIGNPGDIYAPLMMIKQVFPGFDELEVRNSLWLHLFARLRPDVSKKKAAAVALAVYRQEQMEDLKADKDVPTGFSADYMRNKLTVESAGSGISNLKDTFSMPLIVLMSMVGTLLLIACGNVANLLVARAAARQREIAIRISIGASRGAVVRLVLMESLILSLAGAAFGLLLSSWCAALLLRALPFENAADVFSTTPDGRVLFFTLAVSIATGLLFGVLPAVQSLRPDVAPVLKNEAGSVIGGRHVLLRKGLVAAQIALSLLLLIGTGIFAKSLHNIMSSNPGLTTEHILTFSIDPSLENYPDEKVRNTFLALQTRLGTIPGVEAVSGSANAILAERRWMMSVRAQGYTRDERHLLPPMTNAVLPGFFRTLGIKHLAGRDFTEQDRLKSSKVVIVNQEFARHYFGGGNAAVGKHIGFGNPETAKLDMEIVGVVNDFKGLDFKEKTDRYVYLPQLQFDRPGSITFYLRTAANPQSAIESARKIVRDLDPHLPVYGMKTLQVQVSETHYIERLTFMLSATFGILATLLAAFGLYGVMSFAVARRTREIGIRMALGAQRSKVVSMVMAEVALVTALGIGVAIPLALMLGRLVEGQLFEVKANDPVTMAAATALLILVALAAGYTPAMYASRVDPLKALRWE
jgi:predicted permease